MSKKSKATSKSPSEERIAAIRERIHQLYASPEGPRAHTAELERLSAELSELMMERPEVVDAGE